MFSRARILAVLSILSGSLIISPSRAAQATCADYYFGNRPTYQYVDHYTQTITATARVYLCRSGNFYIGVVALIGLNVEREWGKTVWVTSGQWTNLSYAARCTDPYKTYETHTIDYPAGTKESYSQPFNLQSNCFGGAPFMKGAPGGGAVTASPAGHANSRS